MRLVESSIEFIPQSNNIEGLYDQIERAGRICYASEKKEGLLSKDFVNNLIKRNHLSPLEHGTIYFKVSDLLYKTDLYDFSCIKHKIYDKYYNNKFSKVININNENFITTNLRVLQENDWLDDLIYQCEPTEFHKKRYSFEVVCSIGISREWNRHRSLSISEQSTRYCNFSKDKFENTISFIKPYWYNEEIIDSHDQLDLACIRAENEYFKLLDFGCKPQEARDVLPLCTATKVFYTGFKSDWEHWLELRDSDAAHPDIKKFSNYIREIIN